MKPYQRRAAGNPAYFKLATWDAVRVTWVDGKTQYKTLEGVVAAARKAGVGRYRTSAVIDGRRIDGTEFEVPAEKI